MSSFGSDMDGRSDGGAAAGATGDAVVDVRDLRHRYGEREALKGVSLRVGAGEIFGFLGPNGSGKTTLFRVLSTLVAPQSGSVSVAGADVATRREVVRGRIGVVFQYPSLDKELSAEENLVCHGSLYGLKGAGLQSRVDDLLGRVGLRERKAERVKGFSGGMRRRVEIAKGLLNRPRVLLMDEPSTGLDPSARLEVWNYLRRVREEEGVTILMTTHLMDEAEHCDRLAVMNLGEIVAVDSPANLKGRIGGDVVLLTTSRRDEVRRGLRERFGVEAGDWEKGLRVERPRGHELVPQVIEAFPGMVEAVSVGRPTLEDVFVRLTGRGIGEQE